MFSVNSLSSGLRNKIESTAFGDIFFAKRKWGKPSSQFPQFRLTPRTPNHHYGRISKCHKPICWCTVTVYQERIRIDRAHCFGCSTHGTMANPPLNCHCLSKALTTSQSHLSKRTTDNHNPSEAVGMWTSRSKQPGFCHLSAHDWGLNSTIANNSRAI
jgi:hypothetical protein